MAFGKKKDEAAAPSGELEPATPVNLFEEEAAEAAASTTDALAGAAPADVTPAEGAAPVEDLPPAEAAAPPDASGSGDAVGSRDALLSLFQESEDTTSDRSAMLELAGDVEMSDLIDDLRTVAVALRIEVRG